MAHDEIRRFEMGEFVDSFNIAFGINGPLRDEFDWFNNTMISVEIYDTSQKKYLDHSEQVFETCSLESTKNYLSEE